MRVTVLGTLKHPLTYFVFLSTVLTVWSRIRPPSEGPSPTFLDRLQIVGTNPFTFLAFTFLICGWFYYVFSVKSIKVVLDAVKELPEPQRSQ